jgi:hypothetical protein
LLTSIKWLTRISESKIAPTPIRRTRNLPFSEFESRYDGPFKSESSLRFKVHRALVRPWVGVVHPLSNPEMIGVLKRALDGREGMCVAQSFRSVRTTL